jgi:hypothetical protein
VGNELYINVSPDYEIKDSYNILLRSTDVDGLFNEKAIAIIVNNINDDPTLENPIADQTATEDTSFNFTVPANTFMDADAGDNLTYSATLENGDLIPSWLTLNGITFSGNPTSENVGSLNIKVIASDGTTTASDVFTLTVLDINSTISAVNDSITTKNNDNLFSGVGKNVLTGGIGRDSFNLTYSSTGAYDIIADFSIEDDTILVSKAEFGLGQTQDTILDSSLFRLGTSAITLGDRFIYDQTTGNLFFDEDGVGSTAQVQIAQLSNQAMLSSANMTVIA